MQLLRNRAQDQGRHPGIEGCVIGGQVVCDDVDDRGGNPSRCGSLRGQFTQPRLRLDGEQLGDRVGVMDEVQTVSSPDLDHAARQRGQQPPPVLLGAPALGLGRDSRIQPGEERMADIGTHR